MNKGESDMEVTKTEFIILKYLAEHSVTNQRQLDECLSLSLDLLSTMFCHCQCSNVEFLLLTLFVFCFFMLL